MRKMIRVGNKSGKTIKRIGLLLLLICVVCVVLLSKAYILSHSEHEHDRDGYGEVCSVCIQIHKIENLLKQLSASVGALSFVFASLFAVTAVLYSASLLTGLCTPVNMKIRLNN